MTADRQGIQSSRQHYQENRLLILRRPGDQRGGTQRVINATGQTFGNQEPGIESHDQGRPQRGVFTHDGAQHDIKGKYGEIEKSELERDNACTHACIIFDCNGPMAGLEPARCCHRGILCPRDFE